MGFGFLVLVLTVALVVVAFLALRRRARHTGPEGVGDRPPDHPSVVAPDRPSVRADDDREPGSAR